MTLVIGVYLSFVAGLGTSVVVCATVLGAAYAAISAVERITTWWDRRRRNAAMPRAQVRQ
jgi:hypothetical protein